MRRRILLILIALSAITLNAQNWSDPAWKELQQQEIPDWFRDAKFGIYFHWGVYSYTGVEEWYSRKMYEKKGSGADSDVRKHHLKTYGEDVQYHDLIPFFTAEYFDAKDWAKLFKKSGAKFAGPVAEHCDNFSNWDSQVNKYNSVNYGPKRDIVGELEKSIKKEGLKFVTTFHHSWEWSWYNRWSGLIDTSDKEFDAFYGEYTLPKTFNSFNGKKFYSEIDPQYAPSRRFVNEWKTKIFEVVDRYKPDLLYFDSRLFIIPEKDRLEMVQHYYDRAKEWDKEVVLSYKHSDLPVGSALRDLEKGRMDTKTDYPWMTDDSMAWKGWSWNTSLEMKSPNDIVDELVDITSKNGCLLLNIMPTNDGKIDQIQRETLLAVGEWLKVNGEAIYETRPFSIYGEGNTKLKKNGFGGVQAYGVKFTDHDFRFTVNDDVVYITQLCVPSKGGKEYVIKSLAKGANGDISKITILGSRERVQWSQNSNGLTITSPSKLPNELAIVYKVKLK